ncbi:hypothetical protein MN116_006260 [Schistosoma mekongi]|uniref:Queuosine 5'-phosphate N-glycosylase/hydrolase n=1 Tax=Schistosoma mekongi TaxID=38744 RepID=A0AAE1ZC86_SCHME|nr:hypothetical protein MN116_006260 [Schistosoma mekongi]
MKMKANRVDRNAVYDIIKKILSHIGKLLPYLMCRILVLGMMANDSLGNALQSYSYPLYLVRQGIIMHTRLLKHVAKNLNVTEHSSGGLGGAAQVTSVLVKRSYFVEGLDILNPKIYQSMTVEQLRHIFRSHTAESIPLFDERLNTLKDAGKTLLEHFNGLFKNALFSCEHSAAKLLKLLCDYFPSFRDFAVYKGNQVSFLKRAQILVGDMWLCFEGKGFGFFHDIDEITAFADYRVPQVLNYFGAIEYSKDLTTKILNGEEIANGSEFEVEIRAATISAVHNIVKSMKSNNVECNSILVDSFLWHYRRSHADEIDAKVPMHRTRCIYY